MDFASSVPRWKRVLSQTIAICVKNILMFGFGMTLGFPTILIPGLTAKDERFTFTTEGLSWIGSINLFCVPFGSVIGGAIIQNLGRISAMKLVNVFFVVVWLLFTFSDKEWQVFVALALAGLAGGFLEGPVVTYSSEITEPSVRGIFCTTPTVTMNASILITFLLGTFCHWRTVAIAGCIVNVLSFISLFFIPESPYWLIGRDRLAEARKSLAWVRGWTTEENIVAEYKQIYLEIKKRNEDRQGIQPSNIISTIQTARPHNDTQVENSRPKWSKLKPYFTKRFLWPFSVVVIVFFVSHISGMGAVLTYAIPIFESLNAPIDKYLATVILGSMNFIGTITSLALIHFTGKRLLSFVSILGNGIGFALVGVYAHLGNVTNVIIKTHSTNATISNDSNIVTDYNWVPIASLALVAFFSHLGMKALPWILTAELFSDETRAPAACLCAGLSYLLGFALNKVFLNMVDLLTLAGIFWFNSAVSLLGLVIIYFILPETEGKTLGQISLHFSGGVKLDNNVYRGPKKAQKRVTGLSNGGFRSEEHEMY